MKSNLIPKYCDINAKNDKEIIFLGKKNIMKMKHRWNYYETKSYEETIKFLTGKTKEDFQKLAKKFVNPVLDVGMPKDGWGDPEPIDADSINRKEGTTDFNICGWCSHHGCGTVRYNYMISGDCTFESRAGINSDRKFDSLCFLTSANKATFNKIIRMLNKNIEKTNKYNEEVTKKIDKLDILISQASNKPVLPEFRNDIPIGTAIVCYMKHWKDKIIDDTFASGKVISGYRSGDGCLSFCLDKKVHNGDYLEGHGSGSGINTHTVMTLADFKYLKNNPDFIDVWSGGNQEFKEDLINFDLSKLDAKNQVLSNLS